MVKASHAVSLGMHNALSVSSCMTACYLYLDIQRCHVELSCMQDGLLLVPGYTMFPY